MGVLKLSILDEQNKQYKAKMKIAAKDGKSYHVGNCLTLYIIIRKEMTIIQ